MPNIKVKTIEGDVFSVDIETAKCSSSVVCSMVEVLGLDFRDEKIMPVNVNADIMRKIIQWATYQKVNQHSNKDTDDISRWDADFFKLDKDTLIKLIGAAKYLGINKLHEVASKTAASNMISTSEISEEFSRILNFKDDSTPEEEERICQEMDWPEDKSTMDR